MYFQQDHATVLNISAILQTVFQEYNGPNTKWTTSGWNVRCQMISMKLKTSSFTCFLVFCQMLLAWFHMFNYLVLFKRHYYKCQIRWRQDTRLHTQLQHVCISFLLIPLEQQWEVWGEHEYQAGHVPKVKNNRTICHFMSRKRER